MARQAAEVRRTTEEVRELLLDVERDLARWEDDGGAATWAEPAARLLLPELMSPQSAEHPWREMPADPDAPPPPLGLSSAARAAWLRQLEQRRGGREGV